MKKMLFALAIISTVFTITGCGKEDDTKYLELGSDGYDKICTAVELDGNTTITMYMGLKSIQDGKDIIAHQLSVIAKTDGKDIKFDSKEEQEEALRDLESSMNLLGENSHGFYEKGKLYVTTNMKKAFTSDAFDLNGKETQLVLTDVDGIVKDLEKQGYTCK